MLMVWPGSQLVSWLSSGLPAATARPASRAPPGRRTPKTTTKASQVSPSSGGAVELEAANENRLSMTPPMPAIPAPRAKTRIRFRLARMPGGHGRRRRTAHGQRGPAGRRVGEQPDDPGDHPKTPMNRRIWSFRLAKSSRQPKRSRAGLRMFQPGLAVPDGLGVERHQAEEQTGGQGPDGQIDSAEPGGRPGDQGADGPGHDGADDHRPEEVELAVGGDEGEVEPPVAIERPPGGEAAGGDEGGLGQADHPPHAGHHDEGQQDDGDGQSLGDGRLGGGGGLEPRGEPVQGVPEQQEQERHPRPPPAGQGHPGPVVARRSVLGHRTGLSGPVAPDDQPQQDDQ